MDDHHRSLWWVITAAILLALLGGVFIGIGFGHHSFPLPGTLGVAMGSTALLLSALWVMNRHVERNRREAVASVEAAAEQLDQRMDALSDALIERLDQMTRIVMLGGKDHNQ